MKDLPKLVAMVLAVWFFSGWLMNNIHNRETPPPTIEYHTDTIYRTDTICPLEPIEEPLTFQWYDSSNVAILRFK